MRLALVSLKGSPGVSVTAYSTARLLASGGRDAVLVEADPSGGDLAARLDLPLGDGILSLAAEARRGASAEMVGAHLVAFAEHLAVLPSPASSAQASAALEVVAAPLATALAGAATDVVIDLGRLGGVESSAVLMGATDVVGVVVQSSLTQAAFVSAAAEWLGDLTVPVALVVVDAPAVLAGQPGAEEIAALGAGWAAAVHTVAWDPRAVRLLYQPGGTGRLSRSPLWRSVGALTDSLRALCAPPSGPSETTVEPSALAEAGR